MGGTLRFDKDVEKWAFFRENTHRSFRYDATSIGVDPS